MYERSSKRFKSSLKDMLAAAKAPKPTGAQEEVKESPPGAYVPPEWSIIAPVEIPPQMKPKEFQEKLIAHPAFSNTQALIVTVNGKKTSWSHNYGFQHVSKDKGCYMALVKRAVEKKSEELKEFAIYTKNIDCSNGTLQGLAHRLTSQLPLTEPHMKVDAEVLQFVSDGLPLQFKKIPDRPDWDDSEVFQLTESADAGCPFMCYQRDAKCTPENIAKAVELAEKYIEMLSKPDGLKLISAYFRQHPEENTYMMKRKTERMSHEAYTTKVRPYYVPPLALKLLYLWVAYYIQDALLDYMQMDSSCSAYKTSWFYGGTTDFIDGWLHKNVLEAVEEKEFRFRSVGFGDDATWLFVWPDGTYVVLCPDITAMDMHVPSVVGQILVKLVELSYQAEHETTVSFLYLQVLKLLVHQAFRTNLHVAGSFNMLLLWALRSGIPLTTIIDMVFGTYIQGMAKRFAERQKLSNLKTLASLPSYDAVIFQEYLKGLARYVHKDTSATFKEGTLKVYEYNAEDMDERKSYEFSFLGMTFRKYSHVIKIDEEQIDCTGWIPVPAEMRKYAASFVCPSRQKAKENQTMERIYGILLSGAWTHPELNELFRDEYEKLLTAGNRPKYVDCMPHGCEDIDDIFEDLLKHSPNLPSNELIGAMYVLPREEVGKVLKALRPREVRPLRVAESLGVELEDFADMEELNMNFGTVKVSAKHAGKAALPKAPVQIKRGPAIPELPALKMRKLPAREERKKPKSTAGSMGGLKKGGRHARAMAAFDEEEEAEAYSETTDAGGNDYEDDFEV